MRLFEQIRLGTGWFRDSLKTVRLQPLSFTAVVIAYAGIMGLLGLIPIVGIVFAGFFWPFGTIMIAGAGRDTLAGKIPSTRPLAESFAKPDTRLRLVRAGILYSIVLVTAAAIWQFLGADEIAQWQITKDDRVVWSSALQHIPYGAIIASTAFYIPCMMAMWFTPLLIYLKNMTIGKALFLFVHRLSYQSRGRDHGALPCLLHFLRDDRLRLGAARCHGSRIHRDLCSPPGHTPRNGNFLRYLLPDVALRLQ